MSPEQKRVIESEIDNNLQAAYFAERAAVVDKNQHLPPLVIQAFKLTAVCASLTAIALALSLQGQQ